MALDATIPAAAAPLVPAAANLDLGASTSRSGISMRPSARRSESLRTTRGTRREYSYSATPTPTTQSSYSPRSLCSPSMRASSPLTSPAGHHAMPGVVLESAAFFAGRPCWSPLATVELQCLPLPTAIATATAKPNAFVQRAL